MGLPWIRMDTQFFTNPKVLELVFTKKWQAICVFQFSLQHCGAQGTDGFVHKVSLLAIHGTPKVARELVEVGLWQVDPKGWYIPDFTDYQQTSDKTADIKAAKHSGAIKGNCIRWHGLNCGCWRDAL